MNGAFFFSRRRIETGNWTAQQLFNKNLETYLTFCFYFLFCFHFSYFFSLTAVADCCLVCELISIWNFFLSVNVCVFLCFLCPSSLCMIFLVYILAGFKIKTLYIFGLLHHSVSELSSIHSSVKWVNSPLWKEIKTTKLEKKTPKIQINHYLLNWCLTF